MGKSTSAQILAREDGYVYYEADCFAQMKNPYIPLDVENPSMASMKQKVLKGPGAKERQEIVQKSGQVFGQIMAQKPYDKELFKEHYRAIANDIKREKARIGGDFAIAHVVFSKDVRDLLREILGPGLIIINLTMSSEDRRKRVLKRHGDNETAADMMDVGLIYHRHHF